jgi:elongation factor Ts
MTQITASMVKELREISSVGMMECKKALVETQGDMDAAKELLRKTGQVKALKKSSRETREGGVGIAITSDKKKAALVKIACETDFVAKK